MTVGARELIAQAVPIRLLKWYHAHLRDLPWRRSGDPYAIWVSEVMLQQTQVKTVKPYYGRFLKAFPSLADLAEADLDRVLKLWEGLGYYARARNLHRAAGIVRDQFGGHIPDQWKAFHRLPGVGDYIAAAVLSIAFDRPYAVVDGNVKRVLARLVCLDEPINTPQAHRWIADLAQALLTDQPPGVFNQALMELGALVCKPAQPDCGACPLNYACDAYARGQTHRFPVRVRKKRLETRYALTGVVVKNGRLLMVQRPAEALLGGLWEFPTAMVAADTKALELPELIRTQTNVTVRLGANIAHIRHAYTHFKLSLRAYGCEFLEGRVYLRGPIRHRWVSWSQLKRLALHGAMHKLLPHVASPSYENLKNDDH